MLMISSYCQALVFQDSETILNDNPVQNTLSELLHMQKQQKAAKKNVAVLVVFVLHDHHGHVKQVLVIATTFNNRQIDTGL